jgi:thiol-disulfide isomerase/thioredoxin
MVPLGKTNDSLQKILKANNTDSIEYKKAEKAVINQAQKIKEHRMKLVETYPQTFYANLIRIMQEPYVPKELLNKDNTWNDTLAALNYIRQHYFDIINFSDSGYLQSPVYKSFVLTYFDNYIIPIPDTINTYIDKLITKSMANKEQFQYILSVLFNKYANSQIMGYDGIMVYMADKYFLSGMAWWSDPENLNKLRERVDAIKPTLIGKTTPNFIFQDSSLNSMALHSLIPKKRFTMLIFWNSDCGHCQHEIPLLKEKYEDSLKTFDFQIIDISTEQTDSTFRQFARKNTSTAWVTGWDPYGQSAFRHDYDVITTPKIVIIDRKYKIIGKGVGVEDLYKFLQFYSKEPEAEDH